MSPRPLLASLSTPWSRRSLPWLGGVFITVITVMAGCDIVRDYRATVADTGRELDEQARVIAEQTARSVQAVDIVLRHLVKQFQEGNLSSLSERELHDYLQDQAVGLVQVDGIAIRDAQGNTLATSWVYPTPPSVANIADRSFFQDLRDHPAPGLYLGDALQSRMNGQWVFPQARRVENAKGEFIGMIGARGRIDYYQQFYRDIQLDTGTKVTLMHRDGTLLARNPPVESALGKRFPMFDEMLAKDAAGRSGPTRSVSPVDGVERFGAIGYVPDYPLVVLVTRDVDVALAPWREQALGSVARTLALGVLAALLLAIAMRQFARLNAARESLQASQERFAVAVAGSDDGIWEWDYATGLAFASQRALEIMGMAPGPELRPIEVWFDDVARQLHPDDVPKRRAAIEAHLAGKTAAYEGEYRVRTSDGSFRWVRLRGLCMRRGTGVPQRMAGSASDIDSRKRAKEALRVSEERYAIAMTGSHEGHWVWELASDEVFVSPVISKFFGLPPETTVRKHSELFGASTPVHPEDIERIRQAGVDHIAGKTERLDEQYRIVDRTNGEVRWLHTRAQCFRDAAGRPTRVAGATVEITERKHAEEALRQSEERFALSVDGSSDGIVDWDIVNDRMYSSDRAMQILGLNSTVNVRPRGEWRAMVTYHPDDQPRVKEDLRRCLEGETDLRDAEYRVRLADGSYRWIRHRNKIRRDASGRAIRMSGSVSDINAQKRTEEALRRSEERYQLAVEGSNEGLWDWDLGKDLLFLSPRAQKLLWREAGEPLRPRREWIARSEYHPDDLDPVRAALSAHLRGATPHFEVEFRLRDKSDQWHWYRQRGVLVRDRGGEPCRMAGSIEDITDRKSAEMQRDQLEGQLRQAQKLEAIGTLAGGIAHDFNNILAAILGYGEMAQKDAAEGTELRRHIDAALSAAMRAKSLVERILAFSRSGIGERVPVHVQSIVSEALDLLTPSLPPGVHVVRALAAGDAAVLGDPTQIHQVALNLCANAAQAMKGEGALTIALAAVTLEAAAVVTTSTLPAGSYVRLSVQDTGSGIAPHVLERIFDPFFTTKEVGVGTGLGLSLVHGIVTDLGGGIDVQSSLGAGSTFTVFLPSQCYVAAPTPANEPVAGGEGETILLVDDEETLVRLGEELLAGLGYEPVGFASGSAALETFRTTPERFNAVLSDEAMPGMTGSELVTEIRKIRPDIPIIMMSGYVSAALSARARDAGVIEVLAKPLVARDIARSLASALRQ